MTQTRWFAAAMALLIAAACSPTELTELVIFSEPLNTPDSMISKSDVSADAEVSYDGAGSVRVDATGPTTIRIAEVEPANAENATLFYRARLRTKDLEGQAYLEMWARVPGKGEFFSRALHAPLSGTSDWVTQQTPFYLKAGQRADLIKLNLVIDGAGTVWVDDLELAQAS